jgi:Archaeal adenylate kinase
MSNVNIVVGMSGVGKSTVLEEAMKLASNDYEIINYGDRMLETAMDMDLVQDRDELKDIDSETQIKVQRKAAESILEDSQEGNILVDTHAAIRTPQGFLPGLPRWTIENLDPEHLILLDASSEEIYERTQDDDNRNREHDSPDEIDEYRDAAKRMLSAGAVLTGSYMKTVMNHDGEAQQAAQELVNTLE